MAQLLPFLATPVLTRLYDERDFAIYTSFFAVASIFAVGTGGKYQMAIVLPKEEKEAQRIFSLSIYITIVYSILLQCGFFIFYGVSSMELKDSLLFVPLFVLFFGIWSSLVHLSIRIKTFKQNAFAKVIQSIAYIITGIGFGFLGYTLYGLILSKIAGALASWLFLLKESSIKVTIVSIRSLRFVAKKYIDYPKYGIVPSFLNTLSSQALILFLARFYSPEELGNFGLTYMVLSAPLTLIGTSFKDVFYQKIASLISHRRFGEAKSFFKKSTWSLLVLGLPICLIILLFGKPMFLLVFGIKWGLSGTFASILALSFLIKLVVSPLSSVFTATNSLRTASVWQVTYFISTFLTLGFATMWFELPVMQLLYVYVVHELILYSLYYILEFRLIKQFNNSN